MLARQPSHYRKITVVGILLIAIFGGIGGGVSRDVLLNDIPSALTNPLYLILCAVAGFLALRISDGSTKPAPRGSSTSCPRSRCRGTRRSAANKALEADLPYLACILIGVVGPTAGRFLIDITSGVTPQHFVRGEWFVGTAVLTSVVYIIADAGFGLTIWPATLIAFAIGFAFRYRLAAPAVGGAPARGTRRAAAVLSS